MSANFTMPDFSSALWQGLPADHRNEIRCIINAVQSTPPKDKTRWMAAEAAALHMSRTTFMRKYYALRNTGDWTVLIDRRLKLLPSTDH
jgi:hypothetical protein